jgi:hypothetical protein
LPACSATFPPPQQTVSAPRPRLRGPRSFLLPAALDPAARISPASRAAALRPLQAAGNRALARAVLALIACVLASRARSHHEGRTTPRSRATTRLTTRPSRLPKPPTEASVRSSSFETLGGRPTRVRARPASRRSLSKQKHRYDRCRWLPAPRCRPRRAPAARRLGRGETAPFVRGKALRDETQAMGGGGRRSFRSLPSALVGPLAATARLDELRDSCSHP